VDGGERRTRGLVAATVAVLVTVGATLVVSPDSGVAATTGGPRVVQAGDVAPPASWRPAAQVDDRRSGRVFAGLDRRARCHGGFAVEALVATDPSACTHGPDAAPSGVDVRDVPTTAELLADAAAGDGTTAAAAGAAPCYGDGTSGKRVQVVYAVAGDRTDRYSSVVDLIRGYAWNADQAYLNSAARDGGVRHVRWVTDSTCRLDVAHVVLSATGDDSIASTRTELRALGYNRTDRKYLVFADAGVYCGISYAVGDDRPDATNPANTGGTVSRVDSSCWGGTTSVPAHELAHALGAVQLTAPHSNGNWHCTDEYDRLCYADGSGVPLTYLCASSQEPLLDCNGDDYFNVSPRAGTWLSTHWNLANSAYLESVEPSGTGSASPPPTVTGSPTPSPTETATPSPTVTSSPTPTVSPTPTPSPTVSPTPTPSPTVTPAPTPTVTVGPSPTVTVSPSPTVTTSPTPTPTKGRKPPRKKARFEGRIGSLAAATYAIRAGRGALRTTLISSRATTLRVVRVRDRQLIYRRGAGKSLAGTSVVVPGRYRITVTAKPATRFRLTVAYSVT
jgi:hypothetical protein